MILSKVNITYTYTSIKCRPYFVPSHIRRARIDGQTDTGGQTGTGGQTNSLQARVIFYSKIIKSQKILTFFHQFQCEKNCLPSFITSPKDMNVENDKKNI